MLLQYFYLVFKIWISLGRVLFTIQCWDLVLWAERTVKNMPVSSQTPRPLAPLISFINSLNFIYSILKNCFICFIKSLCLMILYHVLLRVMWHVKLKWVKLSRENVYIFFDFFFNAKV